MFIENMKYPLRTLSAFFPPPVPVLQASGTFFYIVIERRMVPVPQPTIYKKGRTLRFFLRLKTKSTF
jgi:hypothetical protein